MNTPIHVFNTWLIAHLLHAFLWWLLIFFNLNSMSIEVSLLVVLIGGITSVPALFICIGILVQIKKANWSILLKAVLWLISILTIVLLNFLIVLQLVEGKVSFSELDLIFSALVAVLLSFLFRLSQLTNYLKPNTTTSDNNLA